MYVVVLVVHVFVSLMLIGTILIQGGRGGMAEAFGGSGSQSLFGGGGNIVMTKVTAAIAALFMVTCLTLAMLSTQRGRSVMERLPITLPDATGILPGILSPPRPAAEPVNIEDAVEGPEAAPTEPEEIPVIRDPIGPEPEADAPGSSSP